jgi:hypothetical protein
MITRRDANIGIVVGAASVVGSSMAAPEPKPRVLPPPRNTGGRPLIDVLKSRHSTREYSDHSPRCFAPESLVSLRSRVISEKPRRFPSGSRSVV